MAHFECRNELFCNQYVANFGLFIWQSCGMLVGCIKTELECNWISVFQKIYIPKWFREPRKIAIFTQFFVILLSSNDGKNQHTYSVHIKISVDSKTNGKVSAPKKQPTTTNKSEMQSQNAMLCVTQIEWFEFILAN